MPVETAPLPADIQAQEEQSLSKNLDLMSRQLTQLESEAEGLAGSGNYPEWWDQVNVPIYLVTTQLKQPGMDPSHISRYYQLLDRRQNVEALIRGSEPTQSSLTSFCYHLGTEVAARGFSTETPDGPIHTAMLELLANADQKREYITPELELLREAYGLQSVTQLLSVHGDEYSDALQRALRTQTGINYMRSIDQGHESGEPYSETQAKTHAWMSKALSAATGLSEEQAANYTFAASRRGENNNFLEILDRFDYFGAERLHELADFTGIHAFEAYSVEQLELMEMLMKDPKRMADHLKQHDVTVLMVNRFGDRNGVLSDDAAQVEDGRGRTLFFEVANMSDLYRRMIMLHQLNIEPSTLILSAHGAPGQFAVSDLREPRLKRRDIATIASRNLVSHVNGTDASLYGYSMHGMKGLARLVDNLMKPSRAVDDTDEDLGRKKIIFHACHTADETESKDIDTAGHKLTIGLDSIIGRLGRDLLENGAQSNIDIYGAAAPIQTRRSRRGVRYTTTPKTFGGDRESLDATRIRIEDGSLTKEQLDEIPLRRTI